MRFRTTLLVLASAAVVGAAGAGAATPSTTGISPASATSAAAGLHGVTVTQRGRRNYAGPRCPGRGWNCTTARRVLQVATDGGKNVGECTGSNFTEPGQSCVIVQNGTDNTARCTERSSDPAAAQHCTVTQTGARNRAFIDQDVDQKDGATQAAVQTADVVQNGSRMNDLHLRQDVDQSTNTAGSQAQDIHQTATTNQTVTGSGTNDAQVDQSETQKAIGGTDQTQNLATAGDCDMVFPSPTAPNACADLYQTSDAGKNNMHLRQSIDEDAKSGIAATQQQQDPEGGIDGHVHQATATGRSTNHADQSKHQKLSGPSTAIQTQYDPMSCCGAASQDGGSGNTEDINQNSSQEASSPTAFQHQELDGTSKTPFGTCTVTQHARDNTDSTPNSATESPCPFLILETTCTSGGGIGDAAVSLGGCFAAPPVTETGCEIECPGPGITGALRD
jgi:hypothetical protein